MIAYIGLSSADDASLVVKSESLGGEALEQPLVSVVISAFNRPEMLQTALTSVLNQTLSNIEIIVQDDSTTDTCEQVVRKVEDRRIRYTRNHPPLGTSMNHRAGYRKCLGKYFSTLNDDDIYAPDYLETMTSILESNPALSLAFCDHYVINSAGDVLPEVSERNSAMWGRSKLKEGIVPNCIRTGLIDKAVPGMFAVFRSDAIDLGDFPDEVSSGYDYWMTYLGVRSGGPIYYHLARLTSYRVHEGSQTSSFHAPRVRLRALDYGTFIQRRLLADRRVASVWPDLRKQFAETCANTGFSHLRLYERREAIKQFGASIRAQMNLRAATGISLSLMPFFVFRLLDRKL